MNWAWKNCIQDRCSSPSTKAPTGKALHPLPSLHPLAWTSLDHITHLLGHPLITSPAYMAPMSSLLETFLFQWTLAQ